MGIGNVTALNSATVRSMVTEQILSIGFKDGQFVKKGELLAELRSEHLRGAARPDAGHPRNVEREAKRGQELTTLAVTVEEKETFASKRWLAKPNCSRPRPIWIRRG
jgi:multidrug efflux pump subunit AcrA (membrane-fusion protein)